MNLLVSGVFAIALAICFIIQIAYILARQNILNKYIGGTSEILPANIPVSVIIAARNEAENLLRLLPSVLNQQYPNFEVVVVNDCSTDDSHWVLDDLCKMYPHLKIATVTESRNFKTGKKFAITMGIKAAQHDCLLFTDADCEPASNLWLAGMAQHFINEQTEIVLGYSPYFKKPGLLNAIIRFETIKTAISYLSAALKGKAYMGVGRNMGYRKSLFFKNKGFASHMHVLSGDDDIFVNQNANGTNTAIETNHDTFVYSEPKHTFGGWFKQKSRHMGAGKFYKARDKRLLTTDALSGFLFYLFFALCLFNKLTLPVALALLVIRMIVQVVIYLRQFKCLKGRKLIWSFPLLDVFYYMQVNVFGLIGGLRKTTRWK